MHILFEKKHILMCFGFPLYLITVQVLWRIWGSTYHQGLYQGGPWDTCCQTQRLSVFDVSFIILVLAKESCKWPFGSSVNIFPSNILESQLSRQLKTLSYSTSAILIPILTFYLVLQKLMLEQKHLHFFGCNVIFKSILR